MHIYPCDVILDVWAKHPFLAIFCGRKKQNKTKQYETKRDKQRGKKEKNTKACM